MNATDKDPDVLKREVDAARADVGNTLDALQAKLSPGQLLDQTMALVQRHGGEVARNLGQSIKQNPLPMMLTGVGIAWLIASSQSSRMPSYSTLDEPRNDTDGVAEAAGSISESARNLGEEARSQAHRAREGFSRIMEEQPLLLGVLGIGLGAAIGAALPPTRKEDELLGETRDEALQAATAAGAEQLDKVRKSVAQDTSSGRAHGS